MTNQSNMHALLEGIGGVTGTTYNEAVIAANTALGGTATSFNAALIEFCGNYTGTTVTSVSSAQATMADFFGVSDWDNINPGGYASISVNDRVVLLGDSITAQNYGLESSSTIISQENTGTGFTLWHAEVGGPFEYNVAQNYGTGGSDDARQGFCLGVSGNTTTQMLARISDVTDLNPDIVLMMGGTNDIKNDTTALTTIKSNIESMASSIFAANSALAIYTVLPRNTDGGGTDFTSGEKANLLDLNKWIRGKVAEWDSAGNNVILIDNWPYWNNGSSSAKTGYTKDGVHPSTKGVQLGSLPAHRAALGRYSLSSYTRHWNQIAFNASTAPYGNQFDPSMSGTGGSTDTAASGDVVDNFRVGNNGSAGALTYVCSVIDSPVDSGTDKWQKIAITSDGTGTAGAIEQCLFRPNPTTNSNSVASGWYRIHAWMYIYAGGGAILNSPVAYLDDRSAGARDIYSGLVDGDSPAWDTTEAYAFQFGTDLYVQANGNGDDWRPQFRIYCKEDVAGTVEVAIGRCTLERLETAPVFS